MKNDINILALKFILNNYAAGKQVELARLCDNKPNQVKISEWLNEKQTNINITSYSLKQICKKLRIDYNRVILEAAKEFGVKRVVYASS